MNNIILVKIKADITIVLGSSNYEGQDARHTGGLKLDDAHTASSLADVVRAGENRRSTARQACEIS